MYKKTKKNKKNDKSIEDKYWLRIRDYIRNTSRTIANLERMDNTELATRISTFLNAQTEPVSKKELLKTVGKLFTDLEKGKTAKKSKDGVEKKKREPTKYNLFMREQMAVLKAKVQNAETELTNREMMARVAKLWQDTKTSDVEVVDEAAKKTDVKKPTKKVEEKKTPKKSVEKKSAKTKAVSESESEEEESEKE